MSVETIKELIICYKGVIGVAGRSGFRVSFRRYDLWEWLQSSVTGGCGLKVAWE